MEQNARLAREEQIQRYIDEQEIRRALNNYAKGVDDRDWDLVRSCYHQDAVDERNWFAGGIDELIPALQSLMTRFESTAHQLSTCTVDVDGQSASAMCYVHSMHREHPQAETSREPSDVSIWARYVDRFERRSVGWRIASRRVQYVFGRSDRVGASIHSVTDSPRS